MTGDDPFTSLETGAVGLHTFFENLMKGGFTEDQALKLIAYMCRNSQADGS
jgi:hypothetical protein